MKQRKSQQWLSRKAAASKRASYSKKQKSPKIVQSKSRRRLLRLINDCKHCYIRLRFKRSMQRTKNSPKKSLRTSRKTLAKGLMQAKNQPTFLPFLSPSKIVTYKINGSAQSRFWAWFWRTCIWCLLKMKSCWIIHARAQLERKGSYKSRSVFWINK